MEVLKPHDDSVSHFRIHTPKNGGFELNSGLFNEENEIERDIEVNEYQHTSSNLILVLLVEERIERAHMIHDDQEQCFVGYSI